MKKTVILVKGDEVIARRRQTVLRVEFEHLEPYRNIRKYTRILSPGSVVDIMMFLIARMDADNTISSGKNLYTEYVRGLKEAITEKTFSRAIRKLTDNGILLPTSRGEYTINPDVLWSGEIGTRVSAIRFNEQPVKRKDNEELVMDRKETAAGEVVVLGDEQKARELIPEEEEAVEKAVVALTGGEDRKFPMQELERKLDTNGNKQGQWDAPLEYPKPSGEFNA